MSPRPLSVSVVMPSYNERGNIAEAVERIGAALGERLLEIIIVDDDSPDGTWKVVEELGDSRVRLIRRVGERGLASALARGTSEAKGDVVVWLDCDLGIPPEMIPRLVAALDDHDVAIGSRYVPGGSDGRPPFRAFLSRLFNLGARLLLGGQVRDYTSGFAAVRRQALVRTPLLPHGFGEYFIDWAYRCIRAGDRIVEVPYPYGLRKSGLSKTDSDWRQFC
ncbi:MAG: polyprenol monophosphomannose synthase, partial [Elusimicrobia bacterium]|nr:polyprenol monophosphomannose synthase [Elusimicrobiota bacterium]